MIRFEDVSVTYVGAPRPALRDVTLELPEGELVLVVGRTGAGKSTLLRAINGLVPHFTGGHLEGRVTVAGLDTRDHPPRDLAHVVGLVGQDPLAGFVTDTVEEELAYGMEQLAVPPPVMRKRVEETLDLLGIAELRGRPLRTLSGGQQQRVAIGSVLTMGPRVLVLDEPTSALDPTAAEEALAAITRLVHDLGVTVVVAEHRMERVVQYADRLVLLPGDGVVVSGEPAEVLASSPVAPPVVELGRVAGWTPLPLSIRDARRRAGPLRGELATLTPRDDRAHRVAGIPPTERTGGDDFAPPSAPGVAALTASKVVVRYGDVLAVRGVDLTLETGTVTALMGRNGSGKSSLLWALQGSGPRQSGAVSVAGKDPGTLPAREARALVGLVPQSASDLLYLETVEAECAAADAESDLAPGTCRALLDRIAPGIDGDRHPRDLSEGQRLSLVLAVQLVAAPGVLMLDEPTRGLDYRAKDELARIVAELAAAGTAVVIATHDVEFVAGAADRVIVMAEGEIVADGQAAEVIGSSPMFAPQVAKVLGAPWLTVDQVRQARSASQVPVGIPVNGVQDRAPVTGSAPHSRGSDPAAAARQAGGDS
ncbi:ATP-binding cassette domain-containing protein [Ornithinimicrobium ciconiae]|uniref:ATP-binding cassette domain-containing protein n=1 Tax=Ornithinimicrobium ciconiae TaxID=2594265 RepID=A0A516G7W4_9MICO|nr:ABC transporter ATP-binding protein [Ornithinimicrobium ciconiae]QDO87450.1 ATP-binding cassette domain-containing protein [Ornithinimicrobium ciconiae]